MVDRQARVMVVVDSVPPVVAAGTDHLVQLAA